MTKDELLFKIQTKESIEFSFKGKRYNLFYDKTTDGKDLIIFGELYMGEKFNSFGDFFNRARIDNYFLKEILDEINV